MLALRSHLVRLQVTWRQAPRRQRLLVLALGLVILAGAAFEAGRVDAWWVLWTVGVWLAIGVMALAG
jgi:type II secretory pathway component PulM